MAKKEERFEVIFRDGSSLKDEGIRQILVDKETGVITVIKSLKTGEISIGIWHRSAIIWKRKLFYQ